MARIWFAGAQLSGWTPVRIANRDGAHTGAALKACRYSSPRFARASMFGVRASGSP